MKRILMIAYHFPPLAGSSGIQRTLRFVQHLPAFGWQACVLTASTHAYERTSDDLKATVPEGTPIRRAFALDTARHLSLGGRYLAAMARPDRWMSWRFDAVRQGMRMIREFKPQAIWSTYPIASAHVIGAELQRRSGLPWIADFRDPMAQDGYPADPLTWQAYRKIELQALQNAARCTFTTPSAAAQYRLRYPPASEKITVLENGYDEESFVSAATLSSAEPLTPGAKTLLHSGIVYPSERDPTQLFIALRRLDQAGAITPEQLKIRFRAAVAETLLRKLSSEHGVQAYIEICPALNYQDALGEMLAADGLLVLQASNCNAQIPAKVYEYLRAGRPVLCLSDPIGDTAQMLRNAGITAIARLDDAEDIAQLLMCFLGKGSSTPSTLARSQSILAASRHNRTAQLSQLLNQTVAFTYR